MMYSPHTGWGVTGSHRGDLGGLSPLLLLKQTEHAHTAQARAANTSAHVQDNSVFILVHLLP